MEIFIIYESLLLFFVGFEAYFLSHDKLSLQVLERISKSMLFLILMKFIMPFLSGMDGV